MADTKLTKSAAHLNEMDTNLFLSPQDFTGPSRPIIFLDVDGCLNRQPIHPRKNREWVSVRPLSGYWVDIDHAVVGTLDALLKEFRVEFNWLTTWGRDVAYLEDLFRGKLRGGFVAAARPVGKFVAMDWKLNAVLAHLANRGGGAPYIWVDDEAISSANLSNSDFEAGRGVGGELRLLIEPVRDTGLTHEHIANMRVFLELHAARQ
jgi:hypothetical protein